MTARPTPAQPRPTLPFAGDPPTWWEGRCATCRHLLPDRCRVHYGGEVVFAGGRVAQLGGRPAPHMGCRHWAPLGTAGVAGEAPHAV